MTPRSPSSDTWRHPGERVELVERLIKAEKRALIAEAQHRASLSPDAERDEITRLAVQVVELQDNLEKANRTIAGLNQRRSA